MVMAEPEKENLFSYTPSEPLALLAAGLFGVSAIVHLVVMIRKRTWFYMALVVGSLSKSFYMITLLEVLVPPIINGQSQ
jgi:hypothetical protein